MRVFRRVAILAVLLAGLLTALQAPGAVAAAETIRVACVGDSITCGAGTMRPATDSYPAQLQRLLGQEFTVGNFGDSGSTLLSQGDKPYKKQEAFQKALAFSPNIVVIMLGTNDTTEANWKMKDQFTADYKDLIGKFRALSSQPKIYVCLPPAIYGNASNALDEQLPMIRELAAQEGLKLIDNNILTRDKEYWFADSVHPNVDGAAVLAGNICEALTGKPAPMEKLARGSRWMIGPFTRPGNAEPIIRPNPSSTFFCPMRKQEIQWESTHTFNPAAIVRDGKVCVLYRAEDNQGKGLGRYTSRLGLAVSDDGITFKTQPKPVFFPDDDAQKEREWYGGCEDPRLMETEDGTYVLFYTQYYRPLQGPRRTLLGMAFSKDLTNWEKKGPVVVRKKAGGESVPSKSGSPVCKIKDGRLVAAKIKGRYWLYYGEGNIRLASSEDLVTWTEEGTGVLLHPRRRCFDSAFPEGGTPAILTEHGIVLLYNGKNAAHDRGGDPQLAPGVYCGGQALFDAEDPAHLLARPETPFFRPEKTWEATGQYGQGTTFIEGLVYFREQWFLYYGCADSFVGVAVSPKQDTRR